MHHGSTARSSETRAMRAGPHKSTPYTVEGTIVRNSESGSSDPSCPSGCGSIQNAPIINLKFAERNPKTIERQVEDTIALALVPLLEATAQHIENASRDVFA